MKWLPVSSSGSHKFGFEPFWHIAAAKKSQIIFYKKNRQFFPVLYGT